MSVSTAHLHIWHSMQELASLLLMAGCCAIELELHAACMQAVATQHPEQLSAKQLAEADGAAVQRFFGWPRPVPLQDVRASLVRQVGTSTVSLLGGTLGS